MTILIVQVDAFTCEAFAGNPAAVCLLAEEADARWMQLVAREADKPATAFVAPSTPLRAGAPLTFGLRWFTASTELELCGHGTLAAAHVLYESGRVTPDTTIRFETRGGPLSARSRNGWIELDFPATPDAPAPAPPGLLDSLGVTPRYVGRGRLDYVVEVESEDVVRGVRPDFDRLKRVETRGVIVTSRSSSPGRDFVSRFFAPATGIHEDAVTGSAHCCLTPFWARRLNKTSLVAHQISSRGGVLKVTLDGDRVRLAGQAVTVLRGELTAAATRDPTRV